MQIRAGEAGIEGIEPKVFQLWQIMELGCLDHQRQAKTPGIMITKLLPAIETDEDVIVLLFRCLGIDMNELSRPPQMKHPNDVGTKGNQDILRHSFDPEDRFAFQGLG